MKSLLSRSVVVLDKNDRLFSRVYSPSFSERRFCLVGACKGDYKVGGVWCVD